MQVLSRLEGFEESIAKNLYKMGFRSLDEVAEASERELGAVEGIGPERAGEVKAQAGTAMEKLRKERLREVASQVDSLPERERLMLVRGMSERVADLLERGGYGSAEAIEREEDADRLAIRAGLDNQRAQAVKGAVSEFLENEWPEVDEGRRQARAKAEAERVAEEAKAEAERAAEEAKAEAEAAAGATDKADEAGAGDTGEESRTPA